MKSLLLILLLIADPSFKWITKCVNEHSDNEKCYVIYDSLNTAERAEVIKVELKTVVFILTLISFVKTYMVCWRFEKNTKFPGRDFYAKNKCWLYKGC